MATYKEVRELAEKCADRAAELFAKYDTTGYWSTEVEAKKRGVAGMIKAVNSHCPLDLEKLLAFDDFNFSHDVDGMLCNTRPPSGKLLNCFIPRCAKPEAYKEDAK